MRWKRPGPAGAPAVRAGRRSAVPARAIGRFLRATRESQSLSQEQLADLTRGLPGSVSRAMISAVERGRHLPGLEVVLTLSQALHISPTEILERLELSRSEIVDAAGRSYEELAELAGRCFWSGDHRRAVAYYDAMRKMIGEKPLDDAREQLRRVATVEIRRGAALRRCGAMTAARAAVERAIALTDPLPDLQAQAYVVLAATLVQVGCLPLARDAANRAVEVAEPCTSEVRGWAWIEKGEVLAASNCFAEARTAFLEARKHVRAAGDQHHEIHVEGNLGACLQGLEQFDQARVRYLRAVELARRHEMPASEALWLLELGRLALSRGRLDEADGLAAAALAIAKPRDHALVTFRAEWLRHAVQRHRDPADPDRHRLAYLKKLYTRLDEHGGIEEVREFKRRYCTPSGARRGSS